MKTPRLCIPFVVLVLLSAQATRPDLTGRWEVDQSASTARTTFVKHPELQGPPAPVAQEGHAFDGMRPQTITHRDPGLVIVDEPIGSQPVWTYKLTTEGKPNVNRLPGGGVHRSTTRWDGNHLVTEWVLEQDRTPIIRGTDRRTLSDDRSRLVQDGTVFTPLYEAQRHIVWIRKAR